jgi:hypothetical protein
MRGRSKGRLSHGLAAQFSGRGSPRAARAPGALRRGPRAQSERGTDGGALAGGKVLG